MTPAAAIAMLDRQVAAHGETVRLSSLGNGAADADCRAVVRRYDHNELIGSIMQGDRRVIVSPTALAAVSWPVPAEGHRISIGGRWYRIMAEPEQIVMADVLVRVVIQVRGM